MKTLMMFSDLPETIPAGSAWYMAYLAEAKGRQDMFIKQVPQKLKVLKEHAIIESSVSSNRIEGIHIAPERIRPVILGKSHLRDRDEEEVRGYRQALKRIHEKGSKLSVSEKTIIDIHRVIRGEIWDAGCYKEKDGDIIEKYPDGRQRIRFKTVKASKTNEYMREMIKLWHECMTEQWVHPLIALAGFNLDFLCIHPFRDGNGRVSRLLLLLQLYHLGFEVGRYISVERLIEENKERYYETLEESSIDWHKGRHDPWPFINYIMFILKDAYIEFEERLDRIKTPRGSKTQLIHDAVYKQDGIFTLSALENSCPGVSRDMIRRVLRQLQSHGKVECLGRGPGAKWTKRG